MDSRITNLKPTTFCGRRFTRSQIAEIQQTVSNFPALSCHELAQTICEHVRWHNAKGENRVAACMHMLEQLHESGVLQLPDKLKYAKADVPIRTADQGHLAPMFCRT